MITLFEFVVKNWIYICYERSLNHLIIYAWNKEQFVYVVHGKKNILLNVENTFQNIIQLFNHRNSIAQLLLSEHYHYYYLLWLEEHYLFAYFACGPQSWFSAQSFILTIFHPMTILSRFQFSIPNFQKKKISISSTQKHYEKKWAWVM